MEALPLRPPVCPDALPLRPFLRRDIRRRKALTRERTSPSNGAYEAVAARVCEHLERGAAPWKRPWHDARLPANAVSGRAYRGANAFLLGLGMFRDHRWLTFRQALELGGHVRKGERSMVAILWKKVRVAGTREGDGEPAEADIPFLRFYHVFNVEQCDGLRLPALPVPDARSPAVRLERAEEIVRGMASPPAIVQGGSTASYSPSEDLVRVPRVGQFRSTDAFYATLFHELGHATGHPSRLNRPGVAGTVRFGSESYGREELVAELASAFCCAHAGLDGSMEEQAAYCAGWLRAIRGDPKAFVTAAGQAQKAADRILGLAIEESP